MFPTIPEMPGRMAFLLPVSWDGRGGCEAYDIIHAAFPLADPPRVPPQRYRAAGRLCSANVLKHFELTNKLLGGSHYADTFQRTEVSRSGN